MKTETAVHSGSDALSSCDGARSATVVSRTKTEKRSAQSKRGGKTAARPATLYKKPSSSQRGKKSGGQSTCVSHNADAASPATVLAKSICTTPGKNSVGLTRRAIQTKQADAGRALSASKTIYATPGQHFSDGHTTHAGQGAAAIEGRAIPASNPKRGRPGIIAHSDDDDAVKAVAEIIQLWRMRQRWHRAEKALVLQGRALCRAWTGGDKDEANKIFDAAMDDGAPPEQLAIALAPFLKAIKNFAPERAAIEKQLRKIAKRIPVYAWANGVKGFGELRLAAVVGEAGDIGSYKSPSALWKRFGLAVIRGERQRRVADAALALEMGYSPERRAVAYLLGQEVMRGSGIGDDPGPYRAIYDRRREYEMPRCEALTEIMTQRFGKYSPKAHAHNRALRYMTKRILRDLWVAWRRANTNKASFQSLPAENSAQAEPPPASENMHSMPSEAEAAL